MPFHDQTVGHGRTPLGFVLPPRRHEHSPDVRNIYQLVGLGMSTRWWIRRCLDCQARNISRQTVRSPPRLLTRKNCLGVHFAIDYFDPLAVTDRSNFDTLSFTDRSSHRADMYAVNAAESRLKAREVLLSTCVSYYGAAPRPFCRKPAHSSAHVALNRGTLSSVLTRSPRVILIRMVTAE